MWSGYQLLPEIYLYHNFLNIVYTELDFIGNVECGELYFLLSMCLSFKNLQEGKSQERYKFILDFVANDRGLKSKIGQIIYTIIIVAISLFYSLLVSGMTRGAC